MDTSGQEWGPETGSLHKYEFGCSLCKMVLGYKQDTFYTEDDAQVWVRHMAQNHPPEFAMVVKGIQDAPRLVQVLVWKEVERMAAEVLAVKFGVN